MVSMQDSPQNPGSPVELDAVVVTSVGAVAVTADGEIEEYSPAQLKRRLLEGPKVLTCHGRALARRAGLDHVPCFDVLELWAFVHPTLPCLPTPQGIAAALALPAPEGPEQAALCLSQAATALLRDAAQPGRTEASDPAAIAWAMTRGGWPWGPLVLRALDAVHTIGDQQSLRALRVWQVLPEWEGEAPPPPPPQHPITPDEARKRLADLVQRDAQAAEDRPEQMAYAAAVAPSFDRKPAEDAPQMVLAEAGTGTGKTLGYLAPATVWAEKNDAAVWVSTYTRNLQHQIDRELRERATHLRRKGRQQVVIRKGRENYLCLLNLEDAVGFAATNPPDAVAAGLMARWVAATRDGDMTGGDFPGWLPDLIGRARSLGLADRRGECIYSACPHYSRCFIERNVRRARKADIVVANHALVMVQTALGGLDEGWLPSRYIFDEGHHLFDAADGAFAGHLTGQETAELRRWLIGADADRRRSRARGLKARVEDLLGDAEDAFEALTEIDRAARALPAEGWPQRLRVQPKDGELDVAGGPAGAVERFLAGVRQQVWARAAGRDGPFALEVEPDDPIGGLLEAAKALDDALERLQRPLRALAKALEDRLDNEAESLDPALRQRIDAAQRGIERRAIIDIAAWRSMLGVLGKKRPEGVVDWFGIDRIDGRELDVGYYRHWIDPMDPFSRAISGSAHGLLVTSATLTDGSGDDADDWEAAERRTGARHFMIPPQRTRVPSPFDYPNQTKIIVVNDVRKDDLRQVAAAYRALMTASDGGALGLFTAIGRLREVHRHLAPAMQEAGLPLYAQHVDGIDVATLVEIFRGDEQSCLLGTDAVRDGVDVPGRALRLIIFDRVPWPRPSILHRARRQAFGARQWDDELTRLKLKQAYGRLVRRATDHGCFVLLDPMMPTRLATAFPEGVEVLRMGLSEAVDQVRRFLVRTNDISG